MEQNSGDETDRKEERSESTEESPDVTSPESGNDPGSSESPKDSSSTTSTPETDQQSLNEPTEEKDLEEGMASKKVSFQVPDTRQQVSGNVPTTSPRKPLKSFPEVFSTFKASESQIKPPDPYTSGGCLSCRIRSGEIIAGLSKHTKLTTCEICAPTDNVEEIGIPMEELGACGGSDPDSEATISCPSYAIDFGTSASNSPVSELAHSVIQPYQTSEGLDSFRWNTDIAKSLPVGIRMDEPHRSSSYEDFTIPLRAASDCGDLNSGSGSSRSRTAVAGSNKDDTSVEYDGDDSSGDRSRIAGSPPELPLLPRVFPGVVPIHRIQRGQNIDDDDASTGNDVSELKTDSKPESEPVGPPEIRVIDPDMQLIEYLPAIRLWESSSDVAESLNESARFFTPGNRMFEGGPSWSLSMLSDMTDLPDTIRSAESHVSLRMPLHLPRFGLIRRFVCEGTGLLHGFLAVGLATSSITTAVLAPPDPTYRNVSYAIAGICSMGASICVSIMMKRFRRVATEYSAHFKRR